MRPIQQLVVAKLADDLHANLYSIFPVIVVAVIGILHFREFKFTSTGRIDYNGNFCSV